MSLLIKKILEKIKDLNNNKVNKTIIPTNEDVNNLKTTGFAYVNGGANNLPVNGYSFYLIIIARNDNYVLQQATQIVSSGTFKVFYRQCYNGTWGAWQEV